MLNTKIKLIVTAGFALFAMFFGSGNLVFPISIGILTESKYTFAAIGLLFTGVIVPFIGLFSVVLCYQNKTDYFKALDYKLLGNVASFSLAFIVAALLGPLGSGPRCILVATAGIKLILPSISSFILHAIICCMIYILLTLRVNIVEIIGKYLTPWLLLCLTIVIVLGLASPYTIEASSLSSLLAFQKGLTQGYLTMDLLAALFFATTTITYLKDKLSTNYSDTKLVQITFMASIIGAILLALIYLGFIMLGVKYAPELSNVAPEKRIIIVAGLSLGQFAIPVVSCLIFLACITTLCALTNLFADFLEKNVKYFKHKKKTTIFLTLGIAYAVSLVGFSKLAGWLSTVIGFIYPSLIVFSVVNILQSIFNPKYNFARLSFWVSVVLYTAIISAQV